jgi:hypothetical protein
MGFEFVTGFDSLIHTTHVTPFTNHYHTQTSVLTHVASHNGDTMANHQR